VASCAGCVCTGVDGIGAEDGDSGSGEAINARTPIEVIMDAEDGGAVADGVRRCVAEKACGDGGRGDTIASTPSVTCCTPPPPAVDVGALVVTVVSCSTEMAVRTGVGGAEAVLVTVCSSGCRAGATFASFACCLSDTNIDADADDD
jgi:hypothetical protein